MHISRLYKIMKTLLQYGLDDLIPERWQPWYAQWARKSIFWIKNKHPDKPIEARIRLALQDLGPVWVKFGQMLSTRRDLLPIEIAQELALLQDKVSPFDGEHAQKMIEKALGLEHISDVFDSFDKTPIASASIAQVHGARLKAFDHADVVIKVIRPNIRKTIMADVTLMSALADVIYRFIPQGRRLRPVEVVREYEKTLIDELDLQREAANAIQLRRNFIDSDSLYIPEVYSDFCAESVLVMERIDGIPVNDMDALQEQNTDLEKLAERGVEVFFTQVFRDSFFHADMHPGNIFVSRETPANPKYIGIDCGIVGTLNKEDKRYLAENFIAFFNRDYRKVAELHLDSGWVPADTNVEEFEFAIRTVCEPIFQKPLAEISFGHVLLNLFNTARRFNMEVQPQLVLLQKTLLYIEGLGRQLYPQLDLWKTAKPFLEAWLKQQIGPKAVIRHIKDNLPFWGEKLPELPDLIYDNLKLTKRAQKENEALKQLLVQQNKRSKQQNFMILGSSFAICGAVLYIGQDYYLSATSMGVALLVWFCSMRVR